MYSAISLKIIMKRTIGCLSQTHKSLDPRHSIHSPLSLSPPPLCSLFSMCGCVDTTQSNQSATHPSCALQSSVFGCFCISLFNPHVISHTTLIFLPSTPFCSLILYIFSCNSKKYYFIHKEWMKIACVL